MSKLQTCLEWYEQLAAANVGMTRLVELIRTNKGGRVPDWSVNIEGALGEMAFAKATGRYWSSSVNTFQTGGDVGKIQVRTRSNATYELYVNPKERDEDIFVLLTGTGGCYAVVGWAYGHEVKKPEYLKTIKYGPAYWYPQHLLHDPESLVLGES